MDQILTESTRLSCLLLHTPEAASWRIAVGTLRNLPVPRIDLLPDATMVDIVGLIGHANRARPLLTTLLCAKYSGGKPRSLVESELQQNREAWKAYQQLANCASFVSAVVAFLRSIAPGYPHESLVFTQPQSGWFHLTSIKELPWGLGVSLIKNNKDNGVAAKDLGLERFLPLSSPLIVEGLEKVASAIKQHEVYANLRRAHDAIGRNHKLQEELVHAQAEFSRRARELQQSKLSLSEYEYVEQADRLSKTLYQHRGRRIRSYVDCFLEYEWLLEKIYWLVTQIVHHTQLSALSTGNPRLLQQAAFTPGSPDLITALTRGRSVSMAGQLLHLTLAEAGHLADGLYQVQHIKQYYTPNRGFHVAFLARRLWECNLSELKKATSDYCNNVILEPEDDIDPVESIKVSIYDGVEPLAVFPLSDMLSHSFTDTMYLP